MTLGLATTVQAPFALIAQEEPPVRVLFVGDIMLDRNVARSAAAEGAYALFATSTRELFADADLRVGNLEGTITSKKSIAQADSSILRFTFAPALAAEVLKSLNFDAVSLANNHALDFYDSGYKSTRSNLEEFGVPSFGHPLNATSTLSAKLERGGKPLCFVGYMELFDDATTTVVSEIETLRPDCWKVTVFAHWGVEYTASSTKRQQAEAHQFIDAGADLVIGAHPHVVQEVEVYQGKAIFYSLGNFMFDQNFSWATTHSLAVRADFYKDKTAFTLVPLTISEQHSAVATSTDIARILKRAGVADFTLP